MPRRRAAPAPAVRNDVRPRPRPPRGAWTGFARATVTERFDVAAPADRPASARPAHRESGAVRPTPTPAPAVLRGPPGASARAASADPAPPSLPAHTAQFSPMAWQVAAYLAVQMSDGL